MLWWERYGIFKKNFWFVLEKVECESQFAVDGVFAHQSRSSEGKQCSGFSTEEGRTVWWCRKRVVELSLDRGETKERGMFRAGGEKTPTRASLLRFSR